MSAGFAAVTLDIVLALSVVSLAWRCVVAGDLFESLALFIGLGVVMSIAWARLEAPDLALAEAALGAGLTGALLLAAWAQTRHVPMARETGSSVLPTAISLAVMALVAAALAPLLSDSTGLARDVATRIGDTGVSHPVTAVLVDFRAFDTLLELCVLLSALLATWQLGPARPMLPGTLRGPVFVAYARIVVPALVLLAGALLWRGAYAPGGAFQAGATLAAAGVLLLLASPGGTARGPATVLRLVVALGVLAFLGLGASMMLVNGRMLDWPQPAAGAIVLLAEGAATLAIGLTLALLVLAGRPVTTPRRPVRISGDGP